MKVFNYYKTANNFKSGNKPSKLFFEECSIIRQYKGLYVLNCACSEYLVYDNVIISERVKISNDLIDDFVNQSSDSFDRVRMLTAYNKAKIWLLNQQ